MCSFLDDDFTNTIDLYIACVILQRQMAVIHGNKENILVPSVQMRRIRETNQNVSAPVQLTESTQHETPVIADVPAEPTTTSTETQKESSDKTTLKNQQLVNPCMNCGNAEKQLACIPCGHFVTCSACSQSLRLCPVCHKEISLYVRIYA